MSNPIARPVVGQASFNPEMLILARESHGLTQEALATAIGITQSRISKLESGLVLPDAELVALVAKELTYPASFFFLRDRIRGLPSWFYRKRRSVRPRATAQVEALLNVRLIWLRGLLAEAELDSILELPSVDLDFIGGTPESIARYIRAAWQVPKGPLRDLTQLVEEAGCIVVQTNFGSQGIDGLGVSFAGSPPTFFLNCVMPVDRQRFTLAHELGHIIMHRGPRETMEEEADRFASELLMPEADIAPFLGDISLSKLASLKPVWRVSMAALLRRARDLGKLTDRQYRYWWTQMGRNGFRKQEPGELDLRPEMPHALHDILHLHFSELRMTLGDVAAHVSADADEFAKAFLRRAPELRLVG